jgi:hypothetical protein
LELWKKELLLDQFSSSYVDYSSAAHGIIDDISDKIITRVHLNYLLSVKEPKILRIDHFLLNKKGCSKKNMSTSLRYEEQLVKIAALLEFDR